MVGLPGEAGPDEEPAVKRILTPEEFQQLLPLIPEPYRTMVLVATCLGLRVSEILGLQWSDIEWKGLAVHIRRAIVLATVGKVKTPKSKSVMPLARDERRARVGNRGGPHIFSRSGSALPA